MSNAARWRAWSAALWLPAVACWVLGTAGAQELELIRAQGEIYSLKQAIGLPSVEVHRASPEFFSVFADSDVSEIVGANPLYFSASTGMMQRAEVFADSIYFHERVDIQSYGFIQSVVSKSDGSILFRIPAGQNCEYHCGGTLWVMNLNATGAVALAAVP